jgi:hypothetical protein
MCSSHLAIISAWFMAGTFLWKDANRQGAGELGIRSGRHGQSESVLLHRSFFLKLAWFD